MSDWTLTDDVAVGEPTYLMANRALQVLERAVGRAVKLGLEYSARWRDGPEPWDGLDGERTTEAMIHGIATGLDCWHECAPQGALTEPMARSIYAHMLRIVGRTQKPKAGIWGAAVLRGVMAGLDPSILEMRRLMGLKEGQTGLDRSDPLSQSIAPVEDLLFREWQWDLQVAEDSSG